jgi:hypothetical protein
MYGSKAGEYSLDLSRVYNPNAEIVAAQPNLTTHRPQTIEIVPKNQ